MTIRALLILTVAIAFGFASHYSASAQSTNGGGNDFLAGILGEQKQTYQGEPNGGQTTKKNQSDPNRNLRLGIHDEESGSDTADAGDTGGGSEGASRE